MKSLKIWNKIDLCSDGLGTGDCVDPGQVSNAIRNGRETSVGSTITYECHDGYLGGGSITCQANGQWSAEKPTCDGMTV